MQQICHAHRAIAGVGTSHLVKLFLSLQGILRKARISLPQQHQRMLERGLQESINPIGISREKVSQDDAKPTH